MGQLILQRRQGESIEIEVRCKSGEIIRGRIEVVDCTESRVALGCHGPPCMEFWRDEIEFEFRNRRTKGTEND